MKREKTEVPILDEQGWTEKGKNLLYCQHYVVVTGYMVTILLPRSMVMIGDKLIRVLALAIPNTLFSCQDP